MSPLADWLGEPIEPGSHIVYPGRSGSSTWMTHAEVLELLTVPHWYSGAPTWALRVQPIGRTRYAVDRKSKPVLIERVDRVTVVKAAPCSD